MRTRRVVTTLLAVGLAFALAPGAVQANEEEGEGSQTDRVCEPLSPSPTVSQPTVIGPIGDEGVRTKEPYGTTMVPLPEGWVEEEFFIDGTARSYPEAGEPETAAYRTRIMVRRPIDPAAFNGTVVVDWNNVTIPHDRDVAWAPIYPTLFERGYAYMSVGAQRLGIQVSPLAVKNYDPVRYGSLNHPGDDYSFDIFSQAAEAALTSTVLGDLAPCVERRIGMGASQSAGRLNTYINRVQEQANVFDAFTPQISGSGSVRRDVVPIIWVNSTAEASDAGTPADSGLFRLWEIAGAAHTSNQSSSYQDEMLVYSHSNGNAGAWDPEAAGAWGYRHRPGECLSRNYYQAGFIWAAALVAVDEWVKTGVAPPSQPRVERSGGSKVWDEHGMPKGGVRGPLVDVPIASYYAGVTTPPGTHPCAKAGGASVLSGTTHVFEATKLNALYPTAESYLDQFDGAVDRALATGTLLPEGAELLRSRAKLAAQWIDANRGGIGGLGI